MILWLATAFAADPAAVLEIRKLYTAAQADRPELVQHTAELNANGRSYAAVGTYGEKRTFWVRPDPVGTTTVVLAEVASKVSAYPTQAEYLYDAGVLRFAFIRAIHDQPLRLYFDVAGKLVRIQVGEEVHDAPSATELGFAKKVVAQGAALHAFALGLDGGFAGFGPEDVEGI